MPVLTYTLPNDLSQLHDQLIAAGLAPERAEGLGDGVALTYPDGTDEPAVAAVVAAHVPQARYDPAVRLAAVEATLRRQRRRSALRKTRLAAAGAADAAGLRAALLLLIDTLEEATGDGDLG